jgi:hypothetical protein
VGYYIYFGRLAYGLGRSVVYYVALTWVASGFVLFIAHVIAYFNIRAAVKSAFNAAPATSG